MPFISLVILLGGCAVHKPMTRQQALNATQKTYTDISKDKFFQAAEKLFRLNDGPDFNFSYTENQLIAKNNFAVFLGLGFSIGTDTWEINVQEKEKHLKAKLNITHKARPLICFIIPFPASSHSPDGPLVYKLFWKRMDYLLGKSDTWPTCADAKKWTKHDDVWGNINILCRPGTKNKIPN